MYDLVTEVSPVVYDAQLDEIVYTGSFKHVNKDMFTIQVNQSVDFERVTDLTTWTPQKGPLITSLTAEKERMPKDSIDALFTAVMWNKDNLCVHIAVENTHPEEGPVTFDLEIREKTLSECLQPDFQVQYAIYKAVHRGVDANRACNDEVQEKGLSHQFTYGEVLFETFVAVLE